MNRTEFATENQPDATIDFNVFFFHFFYVYYNTQLQFTIVYYNTDSKQNQPKEKEREKIEENGMETRNSHNFIYGLITTCAYCSDHNVKWKDTKKTRIKWFKAEYLWRTHKTETKSGWYKHKHFKQSIN